MMSDGCRRKVPKAFSAIVEPPYALQPLPAHRAPGRPRPPLSDYAGHILLVDCGSRICGGERIIPVTSMVPRWGGLTMREVVERFYCPTCQRRAARVELRRPAVEGRIGRADVVLVLRGRGAEE